MSEELEQRFLYTVNPKRVIRNLNENIPMLRVSKSLYLTKEEVLKCLESGSVYRRFSNCNLMEKITKYDLDRVHRDKYISKEDWKKIQEKVDKVENLNVNGNESKEKIGEPIKEELEEASTDDVIDVSIEEAPIKNNVIDCTIPEKDNVPREIVTSGYIEEVNDESIELPETTTNAPEESIEYSELVASEEENEEISIDTQEDTEIDESEEEENVEEENIEPVEQEVKTEGKVIVNYNTGKKKKHKH